MTDTNEAPTNRPLAIYKPNSSNSGSAGKFNVRLVEEFGESGQSGAESRYWTKTKGGLFVDLAKQVGQDTEGNATFGWGVDDGLITAKLGLPDLSGLLVGYREVRERGRAVPAELRPQPRDTDTPEQQQRKQLTVSLFHKSQGKAGGSSTVITYEFTGVGGTLRASKSRELARNLNCSMAEEFRLFRFFDTGLDELLRYGAR